jgi:hypothetical protein
MRQSEHKVRAGKTGRTPKRWIAVDGDYLNELHDEYIRLRQRLGQPGLSREETERTGLELARNENKRLAAKGYAPAGFKL